jgi:CRP-like cAMP-binding protein
MNIPAEIIKELRNSSFFKNLSEEDFTTLIQHFYYTKMRRDRVLFYQNDEIDLLYVIYKGTVQQLKYLSNGNTISMGILSEEDIIALPEIINGTDSLTDYRLLSEVEFIYTGLEIYENLLSNNLNVVSYMNSYLSLEFQKLFNFFATASPLQKIIKYLISLADVDSNSTIQLTNMQIANAIGVTRETVNKYLNLLKKEKILRIGRGEIEILDKNGLLEKEEE